MNEQQIKAAAEEIMSLWWNRGSGILNKHKLNAVEEIIRKHAIGPSVEQSDGMMEDVLRDI